MHDTISMSILWNIPNGHEWDDKLIRKTKVLFTSYHYDFSFDVDSIFTVHALVRSFNKKTTKRYVFPPENFIPQCLILQSNKMKHADSIFDFQGWLSNLYHKECN